MKISENITDFIGVYENVLSRSLCETLIDSAEKLLAREAIDRSAQFDTKHQGDDSSFTVDATMIATSEGGLIPGVGDLDAIVTQCTTEYLREFPVFKNTVKSYHIKFQRTYPSQGYHVWHSENASPTYRGRDLVWTVFLNDVAEGGETEFLYQRRRVAPKQGSVLVWPAAFTHTHRGNPPLSGVKYIATGWWSTCECD